MIFDFWSQIWSDFIFPGFSEISTRMNFEVEKSTGKVRTAWFCHFRVKNRVKGRYFRIKFDFKKSKIRHLIPILTLKMDKSCKSDVASGFLDLKVHPGEIFRQNRENKIGPNFTSKVEIHDLWSHFWPWRWRNHANLTWPVNFPTLKTLLGNFSAKSKRKNFRALLQKA